MKELQKGVYLLTRDEIQEDQKEWPETDGCKNMDFNSYDFWLVTDCGQPPRGFRSRSECMKELREL